MPLSTARPMKLNGVYYFRQRVPRDLVQMVGRAVIKISLRTKDPALARRRHAEEAAKVQAHWHVLRSGPARLDSRQVDAVAGDVYRALLRKDGRRSPAMALSYAHVKWGTEIALGMTRPNPGFEDVDPYQILESGLGAYVDEALVGRADVDPQTRNQILLAAGKAALQASDLVIQECEGDWRPDPDADRFPSIAVLPNADPARSPDASNVWAKIAVNLGLKSRLKYRRIFEDLLAFANTRDTSEITAETIKRWRADLLSRPGLMPRTIARDYLGSIRSIFNCAMRADCLTANPALGIGVEEARRAKGRKMRSFSDEEALTILRATLGSLSGRKKLVAAKRWVPWLCAYTGARVNEMTQVRRGDVRRRDGIWCIVITPDAGTLKAGDPHDVPIHEHLIEQGFLEFVASHDIGEPLFYNLRPPGVERRTFPSEATGKALAQWVRSIGVTDPAVDPNHGWRHRFKTEGRIAGLNPQVIDALQGHAIAGMNGRYGEFPAKVTSQGISKLPRYEAHELSPSVLQDEIA